ncbi:hypothetical protein BSW63_22880 [Salmonella enterica subsp. enterica serovar Enteritidis]|nr:hypothetical protein [Salmonella enterica subsp. enterica serovar Enteritidis]
MMKTTRAGRVLMLFGLFVWSARVQTTFATDDIPEVLRYARQYNQTSVESSKLHTEDEKRVVGTSAALSRTLARSELIRRQQQVRLRALEEKLREYQVLSKTEKSPPTSNDELTRGRDIQTLKSQIEKLNRDLTMAIDKQTSQEQMVKALRQEKEALLAKHDEETQAQHVAMEKAEASLKAISDELVAVRQQAGALSAEKLELKKTIQTLQQQKDKSVEERPSLKTALQRQAYAAGVMYARDVREAQNGNRLIGVDLDNLALVEGLNDALLGRPLRLKAKELTAAGNDLEKAASEGFHRVVDKEKKQAEAWLKTFRKQKGVARDDSGFWYQVTYEGDGERLKSEDIVDVVVEESLINGKVVSDMDRTGNSLRMKVHEFPPVFASGLSRLKNHGQITLVVPPELAYGDKGYPPDVPPGATMIYKVRVADKFSGNSPSTAAGSGSKDK